MALAVRRDNELSRPGFFECFIDDSVEFVIHAGLAGPQFPVRFAFQLPGFASKLGFPALFECRQRPFGALVIPFQNVFSAPARLAHRIFCVVPRLLDLLMSVTFRLQDLLYRIACHGLNSSCERLLAG